MTPTTIHWRACLLLIAAMGFTAPTWAGPWHVTINSTPIAGQVGYLAFDFITGSAGSLNTAVVS